MPSPLDLGAYAWWRCDQGLTLDGSNRVQMWSDSINGLTLGQQTASARPGLTNGRFTTTAVNFDLAGTPLRGLYLIRNKDITQPDSGAAFKFLHNPSLSYHVMVLGRFTGINGNANQFRTLFTTGPVNGIGNPANTSGVGFLFGQDNTGNLKKIVAQIYNRTGLILNSTSANNGWDAAFTPGSLVEACYDATQTPKVLETLANYSIKSSAPDSGGEVNSNSAYGMLVGCQAGAVTDQTSYTLQWYGYIEDIVVFNNKCLSAVEEQELYDYFAQLRGDPRAIYLLGGSNVPMSFAPSGSVNLTEAISGSTSTAFSPSGSVNLTEAVSGSTSTAFAPSGSVNLTEAVSGDAPTSFAASVSVGLTIPVSGSTSTSQTPTGGLVEDFALNGADAATSFAVQGILQDTIQLTGLADFSITPVDTVWVDHAVVGDASITFTPNGSLSEDLVVSGDAPTSSDASATPELEIAVSGNLPTDLAVAAVIVEEIFTAGDASTSFTPAVGEVEELSATGNAQTTFDGQGSPTQELAATGDAPTSFATYGNLHSIEDLDGDVQYSWSPNGTLWLDHVVSGDAAITFAATTDTWQEFDEQADTSMPFDGQASLTATILIQGPAFMPFALRGGPVQDLAAQGAADQSFLPDAGLTQTFAESENVQTTFSAAVGENQELAFTGTIPFSFAATAPPQVTLQTVGQAGFSFVTSTQTEQEFSETADLSMAFGDGSSLVLEHHVGGAATTTFTVAGTVVSLILENGDTAVSFSPEGSLTQTFALTTNVPFAFLLDGNLWTNSLAGILLGTGDLQGGLGETYILGGQVTGSGTLQDPYDVTFLVELDGAGDVSASIITSLLIRPNPLQGHGSIEEWYPLPLVGSGDLSVYLDVASIPVTCPCLCPPKDMTFPWQYTLGLNDLTLCCLDASGQLFSPPTVTYTIYRLDGQSKVVVGQAARKPSQDGVGRYHATGVLDGAQPGPWLIEWFYLQDGARVVVGQPFTVTAGPPLTTSCTCGRYGWGA